MILSLFIVWIYSEVVVAADRTHTLSYSFDLLDQNCHSVVWTGTNEYVIACDITQSQWFLAKYNASTGSSTHNRTMTPSSGSIAEPTKIVADDNSDLYVCGQFSNTINVFKLDSNLNILWSQYLSDFCQGLWIDTFNDDYLYSYQSNRFTRLNRTTGEIISERNFPNIQDLIVDPFGKMYAVSLTNITAYANDLSTLWWSDTTTGHDLAFANTYNDIIVSNGDTETLANIFATDGSVQWSNFRGGETVVVDSQDSLYPVGPSNQYPTINKLSRDSGGQYWTTTLADASWPLFRLTGAITDSENSVWVVGYIFDSSTSFTNGFLTKFDVSGERTYTLSSQDSGEVTDIQINADSLSVLLSTEGGRIILISSGIASQEETSDEDTWWVIMLIVLGSILGFFIVAGLVYKCAVYLKKRRSNAIAEQNHQTRMDHVMHVRQGRMEEMTQAAIIGRNNVVIHDQH